MQLQSFIKKYKNLAILIGIILILIPYGIGIYLRYSGSHSQPSSSVKKEQQASKSPQTLTIPTDDASDNQEDDQEDDPESRLLNLIQNRHPLQESDKKAKSSILAALPNGDPSGLLYQSETIAIEYVHSADLFQVEILTEAIEPAKVEAVKWFKDKGVSDEGLCYYPVSFYLNNQVAQKITDEEFDFNPLPPGC